MDTMQQQNSRRPITTATTNSNAVVNKIIYSAPASPVNGSSSGSGSSTASSNNQNSYPATGATTSSSTGSIVTSATSTSTASTIFTASPSSALSTPKKHFLDAVMLQTIREKLRTPGGACELQALRLECLNVEPVNIIKDRYLICAQPSHISAAAAAKTPASYRHLIDLTSSNLKCTDVFTGEMFLCKIINEPLHKVQRAYFQLQQDEEHCNSSIYGHPLIRGVHDIVPLSKNRTYIIIAAPTPDAKDNSGINLGVYENLHTYIRNMRRLCETEARAIFHQICQTVQVCHRNGIILRDLKLKRFYFIDEARTKLQYESLEGSMILDNPADDTLSDKIGCPLYTAPELLCPEPTYKGKPADMWSLGVILYTMLVGQYPFYEKANCNLITIIRHCHVQIPTSLSKSVRWLLLSLLRKNYAERMPATHIFLTPWLKEQRPFHMYIKVDVVVSDGYESDEEIADSEDEDFDILMDEDGDDDDDDVGVKPLDYTRTTLQMECDNNSVSNSIIQTTPTTLTSQETQATQQQVHNVDQDDAGDVDMG